MLLSLVIKQKMEEIEKKLHSNNIVNVSSLLSKVVSKAVKKKNEGIKDNTEINFIYKHIFNADEIVSEVSCFALWRLVKNNVVLIENAIDYLVCHLHYVKNISSTTNLMGDLLMLEAEIKTANVNYNLTDPKHPFIALIAQKPESSLHIFNKLQQLQELNNNVVFDIFRAFYIYVLCNPIGNYDLLKYQLWDLLLDSKSINTIPIDFYYTILSWHQVGNKIDLFKAVQISIDCNDKFIDTELLILWQINLLYSMSKWNMNLEPALGKLKRFLCDRKLIIIDCVLIIISKIIDICSPLHLNNLLELCDVLIKTNEIHLYSISTIKASILQWVASRCILIEDSLETATKIIDFVPKQKTIDSQRLKTFFESHKQVLSTNSNIFNAIITSIKFHDITDEKQLHEFVTEIKRIPREFRLSILNFLTGLLLLDYKNPDISISIIDTLVDCLPLDVSLSSKLLNLIFYKISNNDSPKFNFQLLKSLPKMIILRDNVPKVMATIRAISKGSEHSYNLSLSLAFDCWRLDNKCYAYLEELLVGSNACKKRFERYLILAHILKELCAIKPELYGKDIIAHLSKILNECNDDNGSLPSSIALEAITLLCKSGVIDINTTWLALSPKFENDYRYPVVKSLCLLIEEIPRLSDSESLCEELINKLWKYVEYGDPKVSDFALSSIATFGMEYISKSLPEKYLEVNTATNLNSVTGKTWVHFLIENNASVASLNFITKMMSNEIDEYLKYIYENKGQREPVNYSYLPSHSVVRSIGEFVKTWANKWRGSVHDKLYIECLKLFGKEYSKPLPPLDWNFLTSLIVEELTKPYVIDIASHQVVLSLSARQIMQNHMQSVTNQPEKDDILSLFNNLKYLGKSIQPVITRPFMETSLWFAIKVFDEDPDFLNQLLNRLKSLFSIPDYPEICINHFIEVLNGIIFVTDAHTQLFNVLSETFILSPVRLLRKYIHKSPETEENFIKYSKIRFLLALNSELTPLDWLYDVTKGWSENFRGLKFWDDYSAIFKKKSFDSEECVRWFRELLGEINCKVAERHDTEVISFLCDLLIFSGVILSGNYVLMNKEDDWKVFFSYSLVTLLDKQIWNDFSVQVLDWLYHMTKEEYVPNDYRRVFGVCLQALKDNKEFVSKQKWMNYLSIRVDF